MECIQIVIPHALAEQDLKTNDRWFVERMGNTKPPHVVVVPYLSQGHLIPALMLAHKLASVGFDVSYVLPEHRLKQIKNQAVLRGCHKEVRFTPMKLNPPSADLQQKCTTGHETHALLYWELCNLDAQRDELLETLRSLKTLQGAGAGPASCIISDALMSWTQDVANELGIPRLVIFPAPVEILLTELYVKVLHAEGRIPIRSSLRKENGISPDELELFRLPGMPPIHPDNLNAMLLDFTPEFVIDFYVTNALRSHEAAGILCNSFTELEPAACSAMQNSQINPNSLPFLPIGPLLADAYFAKDQPPRPAASCTEHLEWLDKQASSSVLYVSFGSIARASAEQVRELALGLEASGHPFLWILRVDNETTQVSFASAFDVLPEGFLSRVEGRCLVTQNFAPQLTVLSHPATAGFLTHSGWNSTLESISLGVPMISMPFFGDQRTNCRMIVDRLKLGIELQKDWNGFVHKEEVERAVKALMDSEEGEAMRMRSEQFRAAARCAFESSHGKLKPFIRQIAGDRLLSLENV